MFGVFGAVGGIVSVLLPMESQSLYLDSPANIEFNHKKKGNIATIWQFFWLLFKYI